MVILKYASPNSDLASVASIGCFLVWYAFPDDVSTIASYSYLLHVSKILEYGATSYALRCSLQAIARFISLPLIWSYAKPSCQWGLDPSSIGCLYSSLLALQIAVTPTRLVQHKIVTFGDSFKFLIQFFLVSLDHPNLPVFVYFFCLYYFSFYLLL